jgi:hypothetical protein
VRPEHYRTLLDLVVSSNSHKDFLKKSEATGSVWKKMTELDSIHKGVLDKELGSVSVLAGRASAKALHMYMPRFYKLGGLQPDPDKFEETFSAAMEFLRSSIIQVRNDANLRKNNPGMYLDNQLFFNLADTEAVVVTNEDFSNEIRTSPQKNRIISHETFRRL